MSTFKEVFPNKKVLLPVIHAESGKQALRNALIAKRAGADGIFLINHSMDFFDLFHCYALIRDQLPDFWIGLNCLDIGHAAYGLMPKSVNGLWVDNAGIFENMTEQAEAALSDEMRARSGWKGLYFGGVAFKYQRTVSDVAKAARLAMPFVDVITTSGVGTGEAADVTKIRLMKAAIDEHPLAVASGITLENVSEYIPYVDCFMVATGISDSHTELNPLKVTDLAAALHA